MIPSPTKAKLLFVTLFIQKLFHFCYLVAGKKLCMNFIDTDLGGHLLCGLFPVTCEHDAASSHRSSSCWRWPPLLPPLIRVRDHDGTGEAAVHSHIDHGTAALAGCVGNVLLFHEFLVSDEEHLFPSTLLRIRRDRLPPPRQRHGSYRVSFHKPPGWSAAIGWLE